MRADGFCRGRESAESVVAECGQLAGYLHRENCRLTSVVTMVLSSKELEPRAVALVDLVLAIAISNEKSGPSSRACTNSHTSYKLDAMRGTACTPIHRKGRSGSPITEPVF